MADKAITELVQADQITATDLFVLQQNDTAKKLPGQVLLNWLTAAADGHGGIKSIEKLKTNVLADTYRITLADNTTFDFVVNNGRGINAIEKISTGGLVDTYRIRYNDNTTGTFTVTNGAKGDKGDNTYIWIKYASQEPTAQSHSIGDVPDAWIGVYFGSLSSAPDDWQQYSWYQIKGEKGEVGDPATLISAEVTYQSGTSGTVIPSGNWNTNVPVVQQGDYLWTRIVQRFNTGGPITAYSVSRMGMDGLGSVVSVAGIAPGKDGNVALSAENIKALPIAGGIMQGQVNMNGQKLTGLNEPTADNEAASKGYVDTNKVDKSKVTSSFDIAAEGYVADARALKVLNDGKLSLELLWKNASPSSEFDDQDVANEFFGNSTAYPLLLVVTERGLSWVTNSVDAYGYLMAAYGLASNAKAAGYINARNLRVRDGYIHFSVAVEVTLRADSVTQNTFTDRFIPSEIYGIKEVPV